MDPSLHPSPDAYWRAQRQSRAMMRKAYREENPPAPLAAFAVVALFVGVMAYGVVKLRETEKK